MLVPHQPAQQFQPANDKKKIPPDLTDPAKVVTIGVILSNK
jgi:hypothetical protein